MSGVSNGSTFARSMVSAACLALAALIPLAGCMNGSGNKGTQTAPDGTAASPFAPDSANGAGVAKRNRLVGGVIGGSLGAGGGYLIGAAPDKNDDKHGDEAMQASQRADRSPASKEDVYKTTTADLNGDGFVTMDELIALQRGGLSDDEIVNRLHRTKQIFDLTDWQRNYLRDHGISANVINALLSMPRPADAPAAAPVAQPATPDATPGNAGK